MVVYMLLEVELHGLDLPHEEVLERVAQALRQEFDVRYDSDVEVECIEHAGAE